MVEAEVPSCEIAAALLAVRGDMVHLESNLSEDVSSWPMVHIESEGSDAKEWLGDPDGGRWLCKPAVTPRNGILQGEDWSEWLAASIAADLGVPAALSRSLREEGDELQSGAVLLQGVPGFIPRSRTRIGHNLENIRIALHDVDPPRDWAGPSGTGAAFGVFCGYLVLDALIANTRPSRGELGGLA